MKKIFLYLLIAISIIFCYSCSNSYRIATLDKSTYYQCVFPDDTIFLQIEKQAKHQIQGKFYIENQSGVSSPKAFSAKVKNDIWHFNLSSKVKKGILDFSKTDPSIAIEPYNNGKKRTSNATQSFYLRPYIAPKFAIYLDRYKKELFEVKVKQDVKYGEAVGYWNSFLFDDKSYFDIFTEGLSSSLSEKNLDLDMDIYLPDDQEIKKRPLLMLIHGGAFYMGDKSNLAITSFCKHFAAMGYTTVSINYRLGFMPNKTSIERAGYQAIQDAHAAMRYLVAHAKDYQIDTSLIFVGGTSAGSITALNLAFMSNATRPNSTQKGFRRDDMGNIESSGNTLKNKFSIKAIANMWGAVNDITMLNGNKTPIVSFHGDKDQIVPYNYAYPFSLLGKRMSKLFFDKMYGSQTIHQKMKSQKGREKLYTLKGMDHEPHVNKTESGKELNQTYSFIEKNMGEFFYEEIVSQKPIIKQRGVTCFYFDAKNIEKISWEVNGGFVIASSNNQIQILWREDAPQKTVSVRGIFNNGAPFFATKSCL